MPLALPGLAPARRRERGSVLLLVISILGLLVLISTTLTYTSRLETQSAANYRDEIEARVAAISGLEASSGELQSFTLPTASTQLWSQPLGLNRADDPNIALLRARLIDSLQSFVGVQVSGDTVNLQQGSKLNEMSDLQQLTAMAGEGQPLDFDGLSPQGQAFIENAMRATGPNLQEALARYTGSESANAQATPTNESVSNQVTSEQAAPRLRLPTELTATYVADLSGRLNINAAAYIPPNVYTESNEEPIAESPAQLNLVRFIEAALDQRGLSTSNARTLAQEIIDFRNGPDLAPGARNVDDDGNSRWTNLENDGIDNDGDGTVDNVEERLMDVALLDDELDWLRDSNRLRDVDPLVPTFSRENLTEQDEAAGVPTTSQSVLTGSQRQSEPGQPTDSFDNRVGIDDSSETVIDPRELPFGDDTPFLDIEYLRGLPSMTDEIFDALRPYITFYSSCNNTVLLNGEEMPRLNLNAVSVEEIYDRLREIYGSDDSDQQLLAQYAANVADWRDPDHSRTAFSPNGIDTVYGLEIVPFISEVYPDSKTRSEDGDDGQFVEIYNPWSVELDLDGWRLSVNQRTIKLDKTLPAGGYLIVTDDYKDENDIDEDQDSGTRYGSFFGIFGQVGNDRSKHIIESSLLKLNDRAGSVKLLDPNHQVADEFEWSREDEVENTTLSYQRLQPALSGAIRSIATPFEQNDRVEVDEMEEFFRLPKADSIETVLARRNEPFRSPGVLMQVTDAVEQDDPLDVDYSFPTIHPGDGIDARVIDHFYAARPWPQQVNLTGLDPDLARTAMENNADQSICHGLININTASYPALMALPGMTSDLARTIIQERLTLEIETLISGEGLTPEVMFNSPSDLLRADDLWEDLDLDDDERIEIFCKMANVISVSSNAFEVSSYYMKRQGSEQQLGSTAAVRAVVSMDNQSGTPEVLKFEFLD
jgi:type II secretory pathway component PulK